MSSRHTSTSGHCIASHKIAMKHTLMVSRRNLTLAGTFWLSLNRSNVMRFALPAIAASVRVCLHRHVASSSPDIAAMV